jgi:hypothetical protein
MFHKYAANFLTGLETIRFERILLHGIYLVTHHITFDMSLVMKVILNIRVQLHVQLLQNMYHSSLCFLILTLT